MWSRTSTKDRKQATVKYNQVICGKTERGTWFEPGWRATTSGGAVLLTICLTINISVLIWASVIHQDPKAPSSDDNPVIFYGSCKEANNIKTWSHLAINVVSTLILSTSTVCMQCLSAPTRDEVDEAHRKGKWLDVGILSMRNLRYVQRIRIILYCVLGVSSIPLHLFYNSVIFTTQGVYDSMTFVTTNDFMTANTINATHLSLLRHSLDMDAVPNVRFYDSDSYDRPPDYHGIYVGSDPWSSGAISGAFSGLPNDSSIDDVATLLLPVLSTSGVVSAQFSDCLSMFSSNSLNAFHNVALVTSMPSNVNGSILDLDFTLAPGRSHWTCNHADWMYNSTDLFFAQCEFAIHETGPPRDGIAENVTEPLPSNYWTVDSCYYQEIQQTCTVVFAKWLMLVVVVANMLKLTAMVYTVRFLDFRPCITVGDMLASFLQKPDIHTIGLNPHSNLSIKEAYRYEVSRIYADEHPGIGHLIGPKASRHEDFMHQRSWASKQQKWRSAASMRRWSVTIGMWVGALVAGAVFVAAEASDDWSAVWAEDIGETAPDFVIPDVSPTGQALLAQTVLANIPQIFLSTVYVFYSGLLTTMLSARELAGFATEAKTLRVSPPRAGQQRSTYFLQVPYRFAIPVIAVVTLLHWLISQSVFLVRLDEYDIMGNLKAPSFESVLGYSLRGTLAALITGIGMTFFPIAVGFLKLPSGIPLVSHNSIAISIACHPLADEPENPYEKPLKYGLVRGIDSKGEARTRIGFSAGHVEPLKGGEEYYDTRCLSTLLFPEHGLEHTCTLHRNSFHMFLKVMKGGVKMS